MYWLKWLIYWTKSSPISFVCPLHVWFSWWKAVKIRGLLMYSSYSVIWFHPYFWRCFYATLSGQVFKTNSRFIGWTSFGGFPLSAVRFSVLLLTLLGLIVRTMNIICFWIEHFAWTFYTYVYINIISLGSLFWSIIQEDQDTQFLLCLR